jgi:hypothetical protein
MSEDREKRKKRLEEKQKHKEPERIKPKLDPYRRSKVRDNDRHGRYEDEE